MFLCAFVVLIRAADGLARSRRNVGGAGSLVRVPLRFSSTSYPRVCFLSLPLICIYLQLSMLHHIFMTPSPLPMTLGRTSDAAHALRLPCPGHVCLVIRPCAPVHLWCYHDGRFGIPIRPFSPDLASSRWVASFLWRMIRSSHVLPSSGLLLCLGHFCHCWDPPGHPSSRWTCKQTSRRSG